VKHTTGTFAGAGGREIFWQAWTPDPDPAVQLRGVVVIVHGAGEHSGRYQHVAQRLVTEGYAVYALDHRGHGRSDGPRALIDRLDSAVSDIESVVAIARDAHPGLPVFMLAHSMGGTFGVQYALAHQDRLAGLILSGPLAALDGAPAPLRLVGRMLSVLAPGVGLIAVDSGLVSRDPQVVEAYRGDPLVHHGKLPARTLAELARAIDAFPARAPQITLPTLILYGTEDRLAPPRGSVMLGERIASDDKTIKPYEGLYHEILNEPERERVLDDLCAWLDAHTRTAE
jgi:alpha-beta hydrolase superfamily lysophospholipase